MARSIHHIPTGRLEATVLSWGKGETIFRVHRDTFGSLEFNPSTVGEARFSPLVAPDATLIPTLYAGTTLDCALMETVFHDVPFAPGLKNWSKATHVAGKVHSTITVDRNLNLIDLSSIPLRKLGISRKELIESDSSHYSETRPWALALHDQYPNAEELTWTSRQADPARALVLFEDRFADQPFTVLIGSTPLVESDGSAILEVLLLAQRLGVNLTP